MTNIKQGLVNKINSNFELDPPLAANDMSHRVFPSTGMNNKSLDCASCSSNWSLITVHLNADMLSVDGGIATIIRPPESTKTGQYLKKLKCDVAVLKKKSGQMSIGTGKLLGFIYIVTFLTVTMHLSRSANSVGPTFPWISKR